MNSLKAKDKFYIGNETDLRGFNANTDGTNGVSTRSRYRAEVMIDSRELEKLKLNSISFKQAKHESGKPLSRDSSLSSLSSYSSLDIESNTPPEKASNSNFPISTPAKRKNGVKSSDSKDTPKAKPSTSSKRNKKRKSSTKKPGSNKQSTSKTLNSKQLTAKEEEELSSALIAQLLAAETYGNGQSAYYNDYYSEYHESGSNSSGSDDDDTFRIGNEMAVSPASRRRNSSGKSSKKVPKKSRVNKSTSDSQKKASNTSKKMDENSEDEETVNIDKDSSSNCSPGTPASTLEKSKPRTSTSQNTVPAEFDYNVGLYSEQEEDLFLKSLDLFGRDWQMISKHMKTRDPKSIRSHAQKHFIKLYRDNLALPDKVAESGTGYTLSGKPLDPSSAAAKPYLSHIESPRNKPSDPSAFSSKDYNGQVLDEVASSPTSSKTKPVDNKPHEVKTKPRSKKAEESVPSHEPDSFQTSGPTQYSLQRPKRNLNSARSTTLKHTQSADPHALVKCSSFSGEPGSGTSGSQPFKLLVHSNSQVLMDFHSHLVETEIIGLLGGYWDPINKIVTVKQSFPCKAIPTDDDHLNVEMDPTSEWLVRQEIADLNMRVVGWYHSHPTFLPNPSNIDIENQKAYQSLFMDNGLYDYNTQNLTSGDLNSSSQNKPILEPKVEPVSPANSENHLRDENENVDVDIDSIGKVSSNSPHKLSDQPEFTEASNILDNKVDGKPQKSQSHTLDSGNQLDSISSDNKSSIVPSSGTHIKDSHDVTSQVAGAPFIGAIVGPYDQKLPKYYSVINWFMVATEHSTALGNKSIPKKLEMKNISDSSISSDILVKANELMDLYSTNIHRAKFMQKWKPNDNILKLTKCLLSLASRMPWVNIGENQKIIRSDTGSNDRAGDPKSILKPTRIPSPAGSQENSLLKVSDQTGTNSTEQNNDVDVTAFDEPAKIIGTSSITSSLPDSNRPELFGNKSLTQNKHGSKDDSNDILDVENENAAHSNTENVSACGSDDNLGNIDIENLHSSNSDVEKIKTLTDGHPSTKTIQVERENKSASNIKDELPNWIRNEPMLLTINNVLCKWV